MTSFPKKHLRLLYVVLLLTLCGCSPHAAQDQPNQPNQTSETGSQPGDEDRAYNAFLAEDIPGCLTAIEGLNATDRADLINRVKIAGGPTTDETYQGFIWGPYQEHICHFAEISTGASGTALIAMQEEITKDMGTRHGLYDQYCLAVTNANIAETEAHRYELSGQVNGADEEDKKAIYYDSQQVTIINQMNAYGGVPVSAEVQPASPPSSQSSPDQAIVMKTKAGGGSSPDLEPFKTR